MERLRSKLNPEEQPGVIDGPMGYKAGQNQYELACGMCGKRLYVDEDTFRRVNAATQAGLDNPLSCDDCEDEYDELFYEG